MSSEIIHEQQERAYDETADFLPTSSCRVFARSISWENILKKSGIPLLEEALTQNNKAVLSRFAGAFPEPWRDRYAAIRTRKRRIADMVPALLPVVDSASIPGDCTKEEWDVLTTLQKAEYKAIPKAHVSPSFISES